MEKKEKLSEQFFFFSSSSFPLNGIFKNKLLEADN